MATFHEYGPNQSMIVMDCRRPLAMARHWPAIKGWHLKAHGFSWVDPRARAPNAFGIVQPQFLLVSSKREARAILKHIAG